MKIGILTFHFTHNFGAMLQAYALCTRLSKVGYNVSVIDYRLPYIYDYFERLSFSEYKNTYYAAQNNPIVAFFKTLLRYPAYRKRNVRWCRFEKFLAKNIATTQRVRALSEINALSLDAVICGSDQIWNTRLTGDFVSLYFCEGINEGVKKLAYAASNGEDSIPADEWDSFKKLYKNFNAVSIRESGLSVSLSKKGLKNVLVLDPVFLLDKTDWVKIAICPKEKNYVVTYSFSESDNFFEFAESVANKINKQLIVLAGSKKNIPDYVKQVLDCGPREFIGYLLNADFVVTNSFHGTAFSILLNKQFYTIIPQKGVERISSLLQKVGLENRLFTTERQAPYEILHIDFDNANTIITQEVGSSLNFLITNLNNGHQL